jgi:DNA-binding transcriptional LysR family regulator
VGLLRVSSSIAFTRAELAPHAPAFLKQYPNIKIDFATRDDRVDLIAEGIDIAFRLGVLADSNLIAKKLGAYRRIVVAAADAPLKKPRQPEDLRALPCVLFSAGARPDRWTLSAGRQQRDVDVSGRVTVTTGRLALDFVRMGLGLALLPTFLVRRDIEEGRLVRVLRDWSGEPVELHAVWATGRDLPRKARAYLDFTAPLLKADG